MHRAILVGVGYWGVNYVNTINALPNIELVGAVDFDLTRINDLKERIPALVVGKELQAVAEESKATLAIVATPAKTHNSVAEKAMSLGLHVLVEKPLSLNSTESKALLLQAEKSSTTLYTGLNYMTHPCVQAVAGLVDQGLEINHMQSERYNFGPTRTDVSVFEDLLPHDVSIACAVFKSIPVSVNAIGLSRSKTTGTASVEVIFENGSTLIANLSWMHPRKTRSVVFSGPKTAITFDELAESGRELLIQNFESVPTSSQLTSIVVKDSKIVNFTQYCIKPETFDMRSQPLTVSLQTFLDNIDAKNYVTYSAKVGHAIATILEEVNLLMEGKDD